MIGVFLAALVAGILVSVSRRARAAIEKKEKMGWRLAYARTAVSAQ